MASFAVAGRPRRLVLNARERRLFKSGDTREAVEGTFEDKEMR